mgnify:CR=1 FL=1
MLGAQELRTAKLFQQLVVGLIHHSLEFDTFRTNFMSVADRWRLGTDTKSAHTIHKCIYRQKSIMDSSTFTLAENRMQNTLFIVDEASMISNDAMSGAGGLLDDLIEFVYSGPGCSMLLLGDTAQLPPVGEVESPALTCSYLRSMFLNVTSVELKQVMRQLDDSGILYNATMLRQRIEEEDTYDLPQITLEGFTDICNVQGEELIEAIEGCYNKAGVDETIILCRSNKRANVYNEGIRRRILYREEELCRGDMLMIVKNNYNCLIEVDGGVTTKNAAMLAEAGADVLVAGSAVFGAADQYEAIRLIKQ